MFFSHKNSIANAAKECALTDIESTKHETYDTMRSLYWLSRSQDPKRHVLIVFLFSQNNSALKKTEVLLWSLPQNPMGKYQSSGQEIELRAL
jgi:hypothetical protein